MNYCRELLYLLSFWGIQSFAVGETKSITDVVSEEIYSCDYTRFETQLERLNLQTKINHETQLNQQKLLFNKMNELSLQIKGIETKLSEKHETERQVPLVTPPVDDKIIVTTEIRETLKEHGELLAKILNNQNGNQELCKKIDLEGHEQTLKNTISDQMTALEKIDTKLTNIEDNFMQKNMSIEIINNQNNIHNLLKEINLKDHTQTQTLKSLLSEKLDLIQKIDEKVTVIGNNSVPKNDQLKFYHDIRQHLNATEICHKGVNSTSSFQSYPSYCFDNKRLIKNHLYGPEPFLVPCREDGGVWTVIQRRIDGSVDFYREWLEYKSGFGNLDGEFFIGLEKLYTLTSTLQPVELLIQLQDFENVTKYAKYDDFQVGNEAENYKLIKLGSYTGDAGDSLSRHVGYTFTTKDRDNDGSANANCAKSFTAAWWYENCYLSNLNGKYYQHPTKFFNATIKNRGINWNAFHGDEYSLKGVQMLIRPRKL